MRKYSHIYLFLFVGFVSSCASPPPSSPEVNKKFSANYQAPSLPDTDRLQKIQAAIPAIEQIYKTYAEKNHFPSVAFGIVADNKLIHSGAFGSINMKAKIPATSKSILSCGMRGSSI